MGSRRRREGCWSFRISRSCYIFNIIRISAVKAAVKKLVIFIIIVVIKKYFFSISLYNLESIYCTLGKLALGFCY